MKFLFEFFISKEDTVIPFDIAICHNAVLKLTSEKLCLLSLSVVFVRRDLGHVHEQRWGSTTKFLKSKKHYNKTD